MNKEEQLETYSMTLQEERDYYCKCMLELQKENQELKKDIKFCLHSIKQEMEMSIDSRTRSEMTSCYEILKRWNK